jgi:hypothetical protein
MCLLLITKVQFNPLYIEYPNPQLETVTLQVNVVHKHSTAHVIVTSSYTREVSGLPEYGTV